MTAKEILAEYKKNKSELAMLEFDLERAKSDSVMKVSKYSDECGGGTSLEDKYLKLIDRKESLKIRVDLLKGEVKKVERALEIISMSHPHECNAMLLKYIHYKRVDYIGEQIGYAYRTVNSKINFAEKELIRLMEL